MHLSDPIANYFVRSYFFFFVHYWFFFFLHSSCCCRRPCNLLGCTIMLMNSQKRKNARTHETNHSALTAMRVTASNAPMNQSPLASPKICQKSKLRISISQVVVANATATATDSRISEHLIFFFSFHSLFSHSSFHRKYVHSMMTVVRMQWNILWHFICASFQKMQNEITTELQKVVEWKKKSS